MAHYSYNYNQVLYMHFSLLVNTSKWVYFFNAWQDPMIKILL